MTEITSKADIDKAHPEEGPWDRLRVILGDEGLAKLRASTVMVLGLGGVGSNCTLALARGGVGHLVVVDRDVVNPSNINRQAVARISTMGRPKTDVIAEMVADINPECQVTALHDFIEKDRVAEQLDALPVPDIVIDAIDTVAQKLRIAAWAQAHGYHEICSLGAANKLDPTRFKFMDVSETSADPLAKVMRKECRKRGIGPLEVLCSDEVPLKFEPPAGMPLDETGRPLDRGSVLGTMSYLPAVMGQMIAGRALCRILGIHNDRDPLGEW